MAGKEALFVGINTFANYPQLTLNRCVNDAKDMGALYKEIFGFANSRWIARARRRRAPGLSSRGGRSQAVAC